MIDRLRALVAEGASRIRDIEEASSEGPKLTDLLALRIEDAGALAQDMEQALADQADTYGARLKRAQKLVEEAIDLLSAGRNGKADGEFRDVRHTLSQLKNDIEEIAEDTVCECGDYNNDGEGFDGKCGNCADRESGEDGEPLNFYQADDTEDDEIDPSITYAAYAQPDGCFRGAIFSAHGGALDRVTERLYDDESEAIRAAARLHAGNEDSFADLDTIETCETDPQLGFASLFYDDEGKFRGVVLRHGEVQETTPLLYLTPAGARQAARALIHRNVA